MRPEEKWIDEIFSKKGMLAKALDAYEERPEQRQMALQIAEAYREESVALIEAGTGTGKSFAYLAPALFWALKSQEKTVISTHTISLQEQLFNKDIPFLLNAIKRDVKVALVKGMKNYLCLRKLREIQAEPLLLSPGEAQEFRTLGQWAETTQEGSKSDIPFSVAHPIWDKVGADAASCNHAQCPHFKKCFFFKARMQAEDAQILIVNHALLFSDIQLKKREKEGILPTYERVVLDEAHHIEQVALDSSAQRLDRLYLLQSLLKVHSDHHLEKSRTSLLKAELLSLSKLSVEWMRYCDALIPEEIRTATQLLDKAFFELRSFIEVQTSKKHLDDSKFRLKAEHCDTQTWKERVFLACKALAEQLVRVRHTLDILCKQLEPLKEKLMNHILEMQVLSQECIQASDFLEAFLKVSANIRWVEIYRNNMALFEASLDVSSFCQEHLFTPMRTAILCSATLNFDYTKERLGLEEDTVTACVYDSPFDYAARALFLVPSDLPLPHEPSYLKQVTFTIERAIDASQGNAFVLFTSYDMLLHCYRELSASTLARSYHLSKQGDLPRHALLEQFKKRKGSVLFATDSFWEGVDVQGDALRCIIIVKLPFPVPSEPLYEANAEALEKEGKDPFMDYAIPLAVIKFKQGFGRLLRSKKDRGCVLCLDPRIVKKNYGKHFLKSLPPVATCLAPRDTVLLEMQRFFKQTD
jgi:ATP-dependent DNA helicase DinG